LRTANYNLNSANLNEYGNRTTSSSVDIIGLGEVGSSVTVNGSGADYRRGEYFREDLGLSTGSNPLWQSVSVSTGGTPVSGNLLIPPATQSFTYDLDGNLTSDGVWTYYYDAENRLYRVEITTSLTPTSARKKLVFEYDHLGRRIRKQVFAWATSDYSTTATTDTKFFYDGWNLVKETTGAAWKSYMWGLDLSGTMEGAGGVEGLLLFNDSTLGAHFPCYDGNGNTTKLVKASDSITAADYEFGPFAEVIRATGPMAKLNPFTFQTEFYDWETDKYYWKNRYYDPSPSKWLSRDPITEPGFYLLTTGHQAFENSGLSDGDGDSTPNLNDFLTASSPNVYAFVDNDAVNQTDPLGLVIIAFYGADYWGSGENGGANPEIRQIAEDVGAKLPPYRSLDIWDPYQYLLNYFRNGPGRCGNEPIKIFGHSWGGISAVKLSRWLGRSELRNHEIDVYTIDPVSLLRTRLISVPSAVTYF
jgi:RHS repeat-associated protein